MDIGYKSRMEGDRLTKVELAVKLIEYSKQIMGCENIKQVKAVIKTMKQELKSKNIVEG